jgi:hypothetical protein
MDLRTDQNFEDFLRGDVSAMPCPSPFQPELELPVVIVPAGVTMYRGFTGRVQPPDCDIKRDVTEKEIRLEENNNNFYGSRNTALIYGQKNSTQVIFFDAFRKTFDRCKHLNYLSYYLEKNPAMQMPVPLYYIPGFPGKVVSYVTTRELKLLDVGDAQTISILHRKFPWQEGHEVGDWFSSGIFVKNSDSDDLHDAEKVEIFRQSEFNGDYEQVQFFKNHIPAVDGWIYFKNGNNFHSEIMLTHPQTSDLRLDTTELPFPTEAIVSEFKAIRLPSLAEFIERRKTKKQMVDAAGRRGRANIIRYVDDRGTTTYY